MNFNSLSYLVFLPLVFAIYWSSPPKYKWIILLISSSYFYMSWNAKYISLILLITIISYVSALLIQSFNNKIHKKIFLYSNALISLGILCYYKYFNFFSESVTSFLNNLQIISIQLHPTTLDIILPVGISFYTFQSISYVVDVYKNDIRAEKNFGHYFTFISFFPQLVAGPIERSKNLLHQITNEKNFSYEQATYGIKLIVWGFFKKLVIANNLSPIVDTVYNSPFEYSGFSILFAIFAFSFQIYCDFSGYSDIAIGSAKLFGINLTTNFKSPYLSTSIKEFWSRWHISLSSWFRDYLYIPLGGNKLGKFRHISNILLTFLFSGLWHGANWTFIIWGLLHGIMYIISSCFSKVKISYRTSFLVAKILIVFIFCSYAWIFFRAQSITEALFLITNSFTIDFSQIIPQFKAIGLNKYNMIIISLSLFILFYFDFINQRHDVIIKISKLNIFARYSIYLLLIILIIFFTPYNSNSEFIYFQF